MKRPSVEGLCCHNCAPVIELNYRHYAGLVPKELQNGKFSYDMVLAVLGWENPYEPGGAELKEGL